MHQLAILFPLIGMAMVLNGCASKSSIQQALTENPEILFKVIEENPQKFAEATRKAQVEARRLAQSQAEQEMKTQLDSEFKKPLVPEIPDNRAYRGLKSAPILLVAYSDFQCPYCERGYQTIQQIEKKYSGKVRFMFKHLPLPFHSMAMPASKRFEALALQSPEKAYHFHDEVFKNQGKLGGQGEKLLDDLARKVGGDMKRMKTDMEGSVVKGRIEADLAEARKFNITGTPGFLINGVSLRGAYPVSEFERIIDKHLQNRTVSSESKF